MPKTLNNFMIFCCRFDRKCGGGGGGRKDERIKTLKSMSIMFHKPYNTLKVEKAFLLNPTKRQSNYAADQFVSSFLIKYLVHAHELIARSIICSM